MHRLRPYSTLIVVIAVVLLVVVGISSLLGRRVSGTFSSINSGLSPDAGGLPAQVSMPPPAAGAPPQAAEPQRLVIKTADLALTVESVPQAEAAVHDLANRLGGYIVRAESSGTGDAQTTQLALRVPAARFDEALSSVQGVAKEVTARSIGGDDVTEEFVDLTSRLRNLEATRDRLLTFLDKATRVEDALHVNQSLTDLQGQIEQLKGRMQFIQQSAALGTINVALRPVPVTPIVPQQVWQPLEVARGALQGLVALGQGLANVLIVLLVWTPLWLPLVLGGRWVARRLGRTTVAQS